MIRLRSLAAIAAATMMFTGVLAPQAGAQQEVKRSITEIGPNLYRFQNNFHTSVFLVTDAGVIATDPINAAAATWLAPASARKSVMSSIPMTMPTISPAARSGMTRRSWCPM